MPQLRPLLLTALALPALATAQFTDSIGYNYNNANSALIGTMIQNNIRANIMRNALFGRRAMYGASPKAKPMGGPPASFKPRPYPVESWLKTWSGGDPVKRKEAYAEWIQQKAIWQQEARARGTKPNDLGQVMATAFVLAYEAYTGNRASDAAYGHMVEEFRKGFAKDAGLRSMDDVHKNELAEGALLSSTDAPMRRRRGTEPDIAKAREVSGQFLDRWWDEKREAAVRLLASKGTPAPSRAPTFESALRITNFRRVSPTVLPEKLAQTMPKEQRQMAQNVSRQVLAQVRQALQTNGAGDVPVDNVGRGLTYALSMLHLVALSSPGQEIGKGVRSPSREQVVAVRKKLLVNLATNPELQRMSDRDKQEMTEMLYFLPAFTELLYRAGAAKGDLKAQRAAKEAARQSFIGFFGKSPESIDFAKL